MSLNDEEREALVKLYWSKSETTLNEAKIAVNNSAWSMAANRIYYACFHAITALFVNDGLSVGTHLGMKIKLGEHYVRQGLVNPEQGRLFSQLASLREKSDYDCLFTTTEEDVCTYLPKAEELIKHIHELINKHN